MSTIIIRDLGGTSALDRNAISAIRGGTNSWLAGLGPAAKVSIGVNQNIAQLQNVEVNALNNVGAIGAGFVAPDFNVSPAQWAAASATI